jgi:hypothetical protein
MWPKGRRPSAPSVILPSLDRLSTLIERVVELVDAVGTTPVPAPEPVPEPPRDVAEPARMPAAAESREEAWLAFVPSPSGYRLVERDGPLPAAGAVLELTEGRFRVLRLAPSPLPRDGRRCVHMEREEPPAEARTFDA